MADWILYAIYVVFALGALAGFSVRTAAYNERWVRALEMALKARGRG
jgi:hypothetical protein